MTSIRPILTLLLAAGLAGTPPGSAAEPDAGQRQKSSPALPPLRPGAPFIGVSYYPEVAGDTIDSDIRQMTDIGINLVRFGDFAWSRLEPQEGKMDFNWMRQAIDKFAAAKIPVTLCTPTAAPPAWLSESHPEILRVNAGGQRIGHGGRRHYCPNSPVYRDYSRRIAGQLGTQFGRDPAVVAWQIDNEFWEECYCDNCLTTFHEWLKQRYRDIGTLNRLWLTTLWSQTYQDFKQIPLPNPQQVGGRHHPSLRLAYRRFMSDSYVSFCMEQVRELRQHTAAPITTNGHNPRYQRIDYTELFRGLDLIGTDSYAEPSNLLRYGFEADWMRPLGGKPFWLAETSSTMAAATTAGGSTDFVHATGALRAKMWLNYALGAEAVSFWLWQSHWAGQELEHGSLVYPWGDETANTGEIRQVAKELTAHRAWLAATRPKPATVALHYGVPTQWQFEASGIASGFDYDSAITAFHRLLAHQGVSRDVIPEEAAVDSYQLVCSPYLPFIDDALVARMRRFVEDGGTWLLGPLSACRTADATAFRDAAYGAALEKWLGVHVRHRLPADPSIRFASGNVTGECKWWCDAYEPAQDRKVLGRYAGGALDGLAAAVECRVGKGRVILLGTQPPDAWIQDLVRELAAGDRVAASPGVEVCARVDASGHSAGVIAVNTDASPGTFTVAGKQHQLPGFGVMILPVKKTLPSQAAGRDANAELDLALRYRDGKGVAKDNVEAMTRAHRAADAGNADAMDFVGSAYLRGAAIQGNPVIALGYFQAAAAESPQAAFNLGQCYFGAQGTQQDVPKALECWKKAADAGHGRAASCAAMAYHSGEGIPPDPAQARRLAQRAAELNDPSGLVLLGEMQFQAGDLEAAKNNWSKASKLRPTGSTGHPAQPSADASAQQGADLLKLMDYRQRKGEPGKFAFVKMPHIHQGYNNCGATACATFARFQGSTIGGWDFKRLCPSPLGTGTDWGHLLDASGKIGRKWKLVTFTPDDPGFEKATGFLKTELDAGRPVVVDFKYIGPQYPNGSAGHTLNVCGYLAEENLYVLCNPAVATPGLQLITAADLKDFWRSDHYGELSKGILSRPAFVIDSDKAAGP